MAKTLNNLTSEQAKKVRLLGNRVLRAYPGSPRQKELKAKYKALYLEYGLTSLFAEVSR